MQKSIIIVGQNNVQKITEYKKQLFECGQPFLEMSFREFQLSPKSKLKDQARVIGILGIERIVELEYLGNISRKTGILLVVTASFPVIELFHYSNLAQDFTPIVLDLATIDTKVKKWIKVFEVLEYQVAVIKDTGGMDEADFLLRIVADFGGLFRADYKLEFAKEIDRNLIFEESDESLQGRCLNLVTWGLEAFNDVKDGE